MPLWSPKLRSGFFFPLLIVLLAGCASSAEPGTVAATPVPTATTRPASNTLATPDPGAYAALGASETYGVGATSVKRSYAYLVARALHTRNFVDVGIPGATLAAAYDTELTNALTIRPALCTVFFGVNDIRAHVSSSAFMQNLHDLVVTLRRAHAQVLIIGIPDLALVPAVASAHLRGVAAVIESWNAGMRRVARQTGAHFLDLTPYSAELARHRGYIASDGLHPSDAGHARLAQIVTAALQRDKLWRKP